MYQKSIDLKSEPLHDNYSSLHVSSSTCLAVHFIFENRIDCIDISQPEKKSVVASLSSCFEGRIVPEQICSPRTHIKKLNKNLFLFSARTLNECHLQVVYAKPDKTISLYNSSYEIEEDSMFQFSLNQRRGVIAGSGAAESELYRLWQINDCSQTDPIRLIKKSKHLMSLNTMSMNSQIRSPLQSCALDQGTGDKIALFHANQRLVVQNVNNDSICTSLTFSKPPSYRSRCFWNSSDEIIFITDVDSNIERVQLEKTVIVQSVNTQYYNLTDLIKWPSDSETLAVSTIAGHLLIYDQRAKSERPIFSFDETQGILRLLNDPLNPAILLVEGWNRCGIRDSRRMDKEISLLTDPSMLFAAAFI